MPYIANTAKNHLLIRHNPGEGTYPKTERCPDAALFASYCIAADGLRQAGRPVPSIRVLFPEAYSDPPPTAPGRADLGSPTEYSIDEWLGTLERPGPLFQHAAAKEGRAPCGEERMAQYHNYLRLHGTHLVGRPMSEITEADAQRTINHTYVCTSCKQRAIRADRLDLTLRPDLHLLAVNEPWDRSCDDHSVRYQRTYLRDLRGAFRFAFTVAKWCGSGTRPRDPRCAPELINPFEYVVLHDFDELRTAHDDAFALDHAQVVRVMDETPGHYRAAILVAVYGTLRRAELLGMSRGNVIMPPPDSLHGQAVFKLSQTWVKTPSGAKLKASGKNAHATGTTVILPRFATEELRRHLDTYRSDPSPDRCSACAAGEGEHRDEQSDNPHQGCALADDAPLWVDLDTGERPDPDAFSGMFKRVAIRAGLGKGKWVPTLHVLRATGATLMIEAGESFDSVVKHGRWSSRRTLEKHYLRPTAAGRSATNQALQADFDAARGLDVESDDASEVQLRRLRCANDALRVQNEKLKAQLVDTSAITPQFRSKGWYTVDDIRRALAPAYTESELCRRLGLTGAKHTRIAVRRKMKEGGLEFPEE